MEVLNKSWVKMLIVHPFRSMVTLIAAFPSGTTAPANITVWSSKKNDRGRFNVYVGQTLLVCCSWKLSAVSARTPFDVLRHSPLSFHFRLYREPETSIRALLRRQAPSVYFTDRSEVHIPRSKYCMSSLS